MSSSSSGSGSSVSWTYAATSILAGVGVGYALGVASSRWLAARENRRTLRRGTGDPRPISAPAAGVQATLAGAACENLVSAIVELTSEVARLRQTIEAGGLLPLSRRSVRGGSTADFVSARGDNTESEDEFFDPNEQEGAEEVGGGDVERTTPNFSQLDELDRSAQESQDACVALIKHIRTALIEFPDNVGLLWRLARALFHLSTHLERDGDTEGQKQLIEEVLEHTQQALELSDDDWQVHKWYAIAVGSLSKYEGTQKKIEMGYKYKEHIDRAIALSPDQKTLYHLRGRFCFEIAGVSWLEKKAAAALFGTPPESTYQEALENLMKVDGYGSGEWKNNTLFIAKCHLRLSDIPTAVEWLHKAYHSPTSTPEDYSAHSKVEELLAQHDPTYTPEEEDST